jgi:hypothetical protein
MDFLFLFFVVIFVDLLAELFTSTAVVSFFYFSDNSAYLMHFGDATVSYGEVL